MLDFITPKERLSGLMHKKELNLWLQIAIVSIIFYFYFLLLSYVVM